MRAILNNWPDACQREPRRVPAGEPQTTPADRPTSSGASSPPSSTAAGTLPTSHFGALVSRVRIGSLARSRAPRNPCGALGGGTAGRLLPPGRGARDPAAGAAGRRFAGRRRRGRLLDTVLLGRSVVVRWNATIVQHPQGAQCSPSPDTGLHRATPPASSGRRGFR